MTPAELVALLTEMVAQAERGHERFCVGIHTHENGQVEEEWVSWPNAVLRLRTAADALAGEGETRDYRELTGCAHAQHESCSQCECRECGTRIARMRHVGSETVLTLPVSFVFKQMAERAATEGKPDA